MKTTIRQFKNFKITLLYFFTICLSIFPLFFIITCSWIAYEVKNRCVLAKNKYTGDCVEVLITYLQDDHNDFRSRNSAVWALGQLGDSRALPTLQSFYTGNIPAREPLDQSISQYELQKAIALANGGFNISALIWRITFKPE